MKYLLLTLLAMTSLYARGQHGSCDPCSPDTWEVGFMAGRYESSRNTMLRFGFTAGRSWLRKSTRFELLARLETETSSIDYVSTKVSLRGGIGLDLGSIYVIPGLSYEQSYKGAQGIYLAAGLDLNRIDLRPAVSYNSLGEYGLSVSIMIQDMFKTNRP